MLNVIKFTFSFLLFGLTTMSMATVCDSVETKTINGKSIILHQVEKGETFYSLSRRYNLSVDEIKKANKNIETLSIGTVLKLPNKKHIPTQSTGKTHIVKPKETLFAIARQHQVSVKKLQEWNHLSSYAINVGQTLIVQQEKTKATPSNTPKETHKTSNNNPKGIYHTIQKGETLYSISKKYNVSVSDLKSWNKIQDGTGISTGTKLIVNHGSSLAAHKAQSTSKLTSKNVLLKVQDDELLSSKLAECFYNGAAEGDIIKITHIGSKKTIFLRVAGHIESETRAEIIINEVAQQRLGITDKVFHVVITEVH